MRRSFPIDGRRIKPGAPALRFEASPRRAKRRIGPTGWPRAPYCGSVRLGEGAPEGGEGFTPDVTVDIFSAAATATDPRARLWQIGYGDLVNVVFAEGPGIAGAPMLNILLRASPGFSVDLYGFDLAGFGSDYTIAGVEVLAGTTSLFAVTNVLVEGDAVGPGHTSFDFATPLSAPELLVVLDFSNLANGIQDNVGLDSVRFGQTPPPIPEPGTALLILVGLVALRGYRAPR